jgi:hypothetical protein
VKGSSEEADPREYRDIGNGEVVAGEIGLALQTRFEHVEKTLRFAEVALADPGCAVLPGATEAVPGSRPNA